LSTIEERLREDLKNAMRSGDKVRRSVVRLILAALHNEQISRQKELDDQGATEVLARMARQYRESIEQFQGANRPEMLAKEEAEMAALMDYLPQQLSRDEVLALAQETVRETGASGPAEKGKVMGRLMPQLRGKADGALVNTVVTELLESTTGG